MKKKIAIVIGTIIVAVILAAIVAVRFISRQPSYGLEQAGNLYDNISNFNITYNEVTEDTEEHWEVNYLRAIKYEITSFNKTDMEATVILSVPQLSDILLDTIDKVLSENTNAEYDDLKTIVEEELGKALRLGEVETSTYTLILSITEVDGVYKINLTDEWNELVAGSIEKLYLEYLRTLIGGMTDESTPG